jgi:enoyl-CoA hydratase/carnithine racemase
MTKTYEQIAVSVADRVLTVTLNRPDKLNAWTHRMESETRDAIDAAAADPAIRAIVVTGAGRGFCSGADMSILEAGVAGNADAAERPKIAAAAGEGLDGNYSHRFSYLLRVPKPVFAAINGPVAGIGLCMTLFCDFRYMASGQKMTTAFAKRGLIAEHGSSWILPRLVGITNALDLLFSARTLLAEEAASLGLVRTLPVEGFLAAVQALARDIVHAASPRSIGVIKRQVYDGLFQSLNEAWLRADVDMVDSFGSEDFREGVAHFMEKRSPAFTGR